MPRMHRDNPSEGTNWHTILWNIVNFMTYGIHKPLKAYHQLCCNQDTDRSDKTHAALIILFATVFTLGGSFAAIETLLTQSELSLPTILIMEGLVFAPTLSGFGAALGDVVSKRSCHPQQPIDPENPIEQQLSAIVHSPQSGHPTSKTPEQTPEKTKQRIAERRKKIAKWQQFAKQVNKAANKTTVLKLINEKRSEKQPQPSTPRRRPRPTG